LTTLLLDFKLRTKNPLSYILGGFFMTTAFVLGNGVSRKGVELSTLRRWGKIYGCNALYREFEPDVLVATDRPIAEQIQHSGYPLTHCFYTRKPLLGQGAHAIPEDIWGYSSGPVAVNLAAIDGNLRIYMLGFDMGPAATGLFNNVYADTEFYKTSAANPTFAGNWTRQIIDTAKKYPQVEFVRIKGATTAEILKFDKISNLKHMPIDEFLNLYK
jgi:hypothetical protein